MFSIGQTLLDVKNTQVRKFTLFMSLLMYFRIGMKKMKCSKHTLEYGINVGQGINVGPGKFGKKNKHLLATILCSKG